MDTSIASLASDLVDSGLKFDQGIGYRGEPLSWTLDCREVVLRQPNLSLACRALWQRLKPYRPQVIAGMTLSADPLIAGLLYEAMLDGVELSGSIIRKESKAYGLQRRIEGPPIAHRTRVVLVDDLINGGATIKECIRVLREQRALIVAAGVIVDFGVGSARRHLRASGIALEALFTSSDLGIAPRLPLGGQSLGGAVALNLPSCETLNRPAFLPEWEDESVDRHTFYVRCARSSRSLLIIQGQGGLTCARVDPPAQEQWTDRTLRPANFPPVICSNSTVVIAADEDGGKRIIGLCLDSGRLLWSKEVGRTVRAIASDPQHPLLVVSTDQETFALDFLQGAMVWRGRPPAHGLAVMDGFSFAREECGTLSAARMTDGTTVWERPVGERGKSLLVAASGTILTAVHRRSILAISAHGKARWISTLSAGEPIAAAWMGNDIWAIATTEGALWLVDDINGVPLTKEVGEAPVLDMTTDGESTIWTVHRAGTLAFRELRGRAR